MIKDTLYAKYIKERQGLDVLEAEDGFIIYKTDRDECFIADMCIEIDRRGQGKGRAMIEGLKDIAANAGCKFISANVHIKDQGSSNTLAAAIQVGFKVVAAEQGSLLIVKDIKDIQGGPHGR